MLLPCAAFSWWLQPQGEQNVRLQTWKERHALALLFPSAWRPLPRLTSRGTDEAASRTSGKQIKQEIFEKRFEVEQKGKDLLSDFLDDVYLPWSKVNKQSWRNDVYMVPMLKAYFEGKALREISVQQVGRFKTDRMNTPTKKGTARQPATVNRELNLLSSAFSLAVLYDKAEFNPCSKVDLFPLDNLRYRYLMPDGNRDS